MKEKVEGVGGGKEKISGGERVGTRVGEKSGKRESVDICAICIGRIVNYYHTGGCFAWCFRSFVCNGISGSSSRLTSDFVYL